MNDLHRAELGENFESSGSISLSIRWEEGQSYEILRGRLYEKNKFIGFINMCVSVNELSCCVLS